MFGKELVLGVGNADNSSGLPLLSTDNSSGSPLLSTDDSSGLSLLSTAVGHKTCRTLIGTHLIDMFWQRVNRMSRP